MEEAYHVSKEFLLMVNTSEEVSTILTFNICYAESNYLTASNQDNVHCVGNIISIDIKI